MVALVGHSAFSAGNTWFVRRVSMASLAPSAVLKAHCSPVPEPSPPDAQMLTLHPAWESCRKHLSRAARSQSASPRQWARACSSWRSRLRSSFSHCFALAGLLQTTTEIASTSSGRSFLMTPPV